MYATGYPSYLQLFICIPNQAYKSTYGEYGKDICIPIAKNLREDTACTFKKEEQDMEEDMEERQK